MVLGRTELVNIISSERKWTKFELIEFSIQERTDRLTSKSSQSNTLFSSSNVSITTTVHTSKHDVKDFAKADYIHQLLLTSAKHNAFHFFLFLTDSTGVIRFKSKSQGTKYTNADSALLFCVRKYIESLCYIVPRLLTPSFIWNLFVSSL